MTDAWATIIAACIALVGVIITVKATSSKVIKDLSEKLGIVSDQLVSLKTIVNNNNDSTTDKLNKMDADIANINNTITIINDRIASIILELEGIKKSCVKIPLIHEKIFNIEIQIRDIKKSMHEIEDKLYNLNGHHDGGGSAKA